MKTAILSLEQLNAIRPADLVVVTKGGIRSGADILHVMNTSNAPKASGGPFDLAESIRQWIQYNCFGFSPIIIAHYNGEMHNIIAELQLVKLTGEQKNECSGVRESIS